MVGITVVYGDLSVVSVPISQINDLAKDNVLFIRLVTNLRTGTEANISQINGFDNYAVLHRKKDGDDWYMLCGWDEDDFIWRRECADCENRVVVDLPIGRMHVKFEGIAVTEAEWQNAITVINNL